MKRIILIVLSFWFIGCGDDKADSNLNATAQTQSENDNPVDANGNPLYTLETHYRFTLNGHDVVIWGVDTAFGKANDNASAYFFDLNVPCGTRMIVRQAKTGLNDYTVQIGASGDIYEECSQLRGLYTLKLTGPTTGNVVYVGDDDDYF